MQPAAIGDDYDAAAAMMERGAFLRKLRELERQDEVERASAAASDPGTETGDSCTLNYQSYLEHQEYHDDYKHVNYRFIDFGLVGDRSLVIEQDRSVGKGGLVWDAGFILGEHLLQQHPQLQADLLGDQDKQNHTQTRAPATIIELGAGTGVTGLMVASSFGQNARVHLTDLPLLVPLMEANSKSFSNVTAGVLEWGKPLPSSLSYDIILGADVVASIYDSSGLARTMYDLAHNRSQVYLSIRDRLAGSIERFEDHLRRYFDRVERHKAISSNLNPDVYILYATGRKSDQ